MSLSFQYKTKKELKASVGQPLLYEETSIFGKELKLTEGTTRVVSGANYGTYPSFNNPSSWYANVTVNVINGVPIILSVK